MDLNPIGLKPIGELLVICYWLMFKRDKILHFIGRTVKTPNDDLNEQDAIIEF